MIEWFFLSVMEHTASNIDTFITLLPSLLKVFEMFQIRLLYYEHIEEEHVVEAIATEFRNFDSNTSLYLKNTTDE